MAKQLRCPQGHEWTADVGAAGASRCPVCGNTATLVNGTPPAPVVETLQYTPKTNPQVDANAPTLAPEEPQWVLPVERPRFAGYEIVDEIGRGGMGVVYKAEQLSLKRPVALKMILAGSHAGKDHRSRFHREAEAVARLHHPNIVQIYEISEHEGKPYLALEFVDGGNLAQRISDFGFASGDSKHDPAKIAHLVECLARAVHHAHQRGIIHRDLKPGNVLLMADGTPKITDFGLAKQFQGDTPVTGQGAATVTGAIMGTPSYMAPEQADGKKRAVGPAADVYALGAILYEMLTGQPPFKGDSPMSTAIKVVTEEPLPPRRLQPRVPRDLETICMKCLEKDPTKRYGTAEALAEDLRRFQEGDAITARRLGVAGRTGRWMLKRWKPVALVGSGVFLTFAFLICLGFFGIYWFDEQTPDLREPLDLQGLEGAWEVVSAESNGQSLTPERVQATRIIFEGPRLTITDPDGKIAGRAAIDPKAIPHSSIDVLQLDGPRILKLGILKLESDQLWLCLSTSDLIVERPKDFSAARGSNRILFQARRAGQDSAAGDLARFQGTWAVTGVTENGRETPAQFLTDARVTCKGNRFSFQMPGESGEAIIHINASRSPREADFTAAGVEAGKLSLVNGLAIYQFKLYDPDTVVVCFHPDGKTRPTDFTAKAGSGRVMITMKRIGGPTPVSSDRDSLIGAWELVSAVMNGMPVPEAQRRLGRLELTASGLVFRSANQMHQAKYEIDPTRSPKTIDLYTNEASAAGIVPGAGIYELKGDNLRLCLAERGKPRPTEFDSPPGSDHMLMVLKRAGTRPTEAPLPPDLNLVPRDATAFVSVRGADFLASDSAKRLQEGLAKGSPALEGFLKSWQELATQTFGIAPLDIERATLVVLDGDDAVVIVATKGPYDREKLLKRTGTQVQPLQPDPKRYFMVSGKGGVKHSLYLVSDTVLIIGISESDAGGAAPSGDPTKRPPRVMQQVARVRGHVIQVQQNGKIVISLPEGATARQGNGVLLYRPDGQGDPLSRRIGVVEIVEVGKEQVIAQLIPGQPFPDRIQVNDVALFVPRPAVRPPIERHTSIEDLIWQLPMANHDGPLQPALQEAAGKHHAVIGLNIAKVPFADMFSQQMFPSLQTAKPLGEASTAIIALNLHSLSLREEATLHIDARLRFPGEGSAARGFAAAQAAQVVVRDSLQEWMRVVGPALSKFESSWGSVTRHLVYFADELSVALRSSRVVERHGNDVLITLPLRFDFAQLGKLQGDAVEKVREAADRARSQNNLKMLVLGFMEYERVHGTYPPVCTTTADGKPLLSWRVLILPHLKDPNLTALYKRFRLEEPWDSPHNLRLLDQMPEVYLNPSIPPAKGASRTHYQRIVGPVGATEPVGAPPLRPQDIIDGLANTLLLVEAEKVVPWTKPEDVGYDPREAPPKLGGITPGEFNGAFGNGSVRRFASTLDEKTLRAIITRAGKEPVDVSKLP